MRYLAALPVMGLFAAVSGMDMCPAKPMPGGSWAWPASLGPAPPGEYPTSYGPGSSGSSPEGSGSYPGGSGSYPEGSGSYPGGSGSYPGGSGSSGGKGARPVSSYPHNYPGQGPSYPNTPYNPDKSSEWEDWNNTSPGCTNGPTSRGCWSDGCDIHTDNWVTWPQNGNTVEYTLTITNTTLSPDGVSHLRLAVNGQVPGPTIEANWGDYIKITVVNKMQNNGTSIHWHGLRQLNSNNQDGVNGVTECPLAPGASKTYLFQATEYGTSWYHSHFSAQYGDGVQGPIVIHGPCSANYDEDLGPILVSDSYDQTAFQEDYAAERQGPPTASNYLLNGKNIRPDGSAGSRQVWTFQKGKKYLLRFVNTSMDSHFSIQIDNHNLTVTSSDFVPIVPYSTTSLQLGIGQRYDCVVEANQDVGNYYLRAIAAQGPPSGCSSNANTGLGNANGIISYEGAPDPSTNLPTSTNWPYSNACQDEPYASLVPVVSKTIPSDGIASKVSSLPVGGPSLLPFGDEFLFRWYLNGVSQSIDWSNPTLAQVAAGDTSFDTIENAIVLPNRGVWTFWVIQNEFFVAHPMHLHGHDFAILGQGSGTFSSADLSSLNFDNPPRRDVTLLTAQGWTVIAFQTDNPGAWLMHCHIVYHVGEGLGLQFVEIPSEIPSSFTSGSFFQDTCTSWKSYIASGPAYNKTDSGLKARSQQLRERQRAFDLDHKGKRHLHAHNYKNRGHARNLFT